ncbi:MAG: N-acetyltransferase [Actinobacteria bacterium]|nr:N-acetyltransferase [Actinomycetota bacterium]
MSGWIVRLADADDIDGIKKVADANRKDLGFVLRSVLLAGIGRNEVHVIDDGQIVGFIHWHMRRDGWVTVYEIGTMMRGKGLGRMLLRSVPRPVQLKCPEGAEANGFYERMNGTHVATVDGRKRRLNIWQWSFNDARDISQPESRT